MESNVSKINEAIVAAEERGYEIDRNGRVIGPKGRLLKLQFDREGRPTFGVRMYTYTVKVPVSKYQAYKKFGSRVFRPGIQVRHLDDVSTNNTWDNIEIGTQSDNKRDQPACVRLRLARNAASYLRKLTCEQVREARQLKLEGWTLRRLCSKYGVAKSTMSGIVNCKQYTDVK